MDRKKKNNKENVHLTTTKNEPLVAKNKINHSLQEKKQFNATLVDNTGEAGFEQGHSVFYCQLACFEFLTAKLRWPPTNIIDINGLCHLMFLH